MYDVEGDKKWLHHPGIIFALNRSNTVLHVRYDIRTLLIIGALLSLDDSLQIEARLQQGTALCSEYGFRVTGASRRIFALKPTTGHSWSPLYSRFLTPEVGSFTP